MSEIRYLISDASKKVDVETHVLRYWEEELGLSIPRNEMGHRYYTEFHIRLFCQIKKLKDRGYQLKAIKNALQQVTGQNQGFMQAAGILEEDMTRTLQENQPFVFIKDKDGRFENITRLADYNRLEPVEEEQLTKDKQREKEEGRQVVKENKEEKMQNKPEIKEKDGQTEMKKKGKNRKKPSAWERRNGITGNEQNLSRESDSGDFYEEAFLKMKQERNIQDKTIQQKYAEEECIRQKNIQNEHMQQKYTQEEHTQQKYTQEEHTQQKYTQEEHTQQKNTQEGYRQEKYIQVGDTEQKYIQEEHIQPKHVQEEQLMETDFLENNETKENEYLLKMEVKSEVNRPLEKDAHLERNIALGTNTSLEEDVQLNTSEVLKKEPQLDTDTHSESDTTELARSSAKPSSALLLISQDEKMQQFQQIMNHIIGHALEANNEKLSQEISNLVNERLSEELEDLMRIRDERDEERFRQFDEIIRSYQRESQGKAEAAAAKVPFFRRGRFKKNRHPQNA